MPVTAAPPFYLVTLVEPFVAPDGKSYMALFGPCVNQGDDTLYIGNMAIPKDSIHVVIRTYALPNLGDIEEVVVVDGQTERVVRPTLIYVCPPEEMTA